MACPKRKLDVEPDPDYEDNRAHETKRLRRLEESAKAGLSQKVSAIIIREFDEELSNKEKEVKEIQERLYAAQKTLHLLRYVVVSSYFRNKHSESAAPQSSEQPKRIHPAIKKLLGKEPRLHTTEPLEPRQSRWRSSGNHNQDAQPSKASEETITEKEKAHETITKVPRYIPPKGSNSSNKVEVKEPRGMQLKVKKRLVIGNISKWIPIDTREDDASHKWMMYVRGPKEAPDISGFVSKVRFFLHPSYQPHDVVDICTPPFHLARRGWGEFPVRVQVHFLHPLNKPVDIIHQLKLDQTRTGLQTLGAETVVDIWLHRTPAISNSEVVEDDHLIPEDKVPVVEQSEAVDSPGVTLYEEDGHTTIVHDMSFVSCNKVKQENNSTVIKQEQDIGLECPQRLVPICDSGQSYSFNKDSEHCGEMKIKQEMDVCCSDTEDVVKINESERFINSEIKVEDDFHDLLNDKFRSGDSEFFSRTKSVDVSLSFDHDYISSPLPDQDLANSVMKSPAEELVIGEEVIVSSSCDLNSDLDHSLIGTDQSSNNQNMEVNISSNKNVNLLEQRNQVNNINRNNNALQKSFYSQEVDYGHSVKKHLTNNISPSKSLTSHIMPQNSELLTNLSNPSVENVDSITKLNAINNNGLQSSKLLSFSSENTTQTKILPVSNTFSKPTTLVKCIDKSGNAFYITIGGQNAKTQSKLSGNLLAKTVQSGTARTVSGDLKANQSVSLLSNLLLSKENQHLSKTPSPVLKGKTANFENPAQFVSVNGQVMKSLITQKTSLLSTPKTSPIKSIVNNVHTSINLPPKQSQPALISGRINNCLSKSSLLSEVYNSFTATKSIMKPIGSPSGSMLEGITSVDSSVGSDKLQTSSLLVKPNVRLANKSTPGIQVMSDPRTLLSSKASPKGNSLLNHQAQGQSLLLVKDGQIFLVKQSPPASIAPTKVNSSVIRSAASAKPTVLLPSFNSSSSVNTSTVLNPVVLQPPVNSAGGVLKVNPAASGVRTYFGLAKPGVSLLKKNVVNPKAEATEVCDDMVKREKDEKLLEEQRLLFSGRTLVLNKANSRIVVNPKKPKFEEDLKEAISCCKFDDVQKRVSWLLRHFPLVHPEASQPEFRVLHPYAATSEAMFLQWNHGKRKAAEWLRAKAVQSALREGGISEEEIWSTRNIAVWAKLHGHTPLSLNRSVLTDTKPSLPDLEQMASKVSSTYSEPVKIMEWLEANLEANCGTVEDDVDVDVVRLSPPAVKVKEEPEPLEELTVMDVSPSDMSDCIFVRETARELGIKFPPEQIIPGVLYCAAERILVQAMRSFMEDLLRRSFRKAWERNSNSQPDSINLGDTKEAILDRSEFDMFTNIGLGVQAADTG